MSSYVDRAGVEQQSILSWGFCCYSGAIKKVDSDSSVSVACSGSRAGQITAGIHRFPETSKKEISYWNLYDNI